MEGYCFILTRCHDEMSSDVVRLSFHCVVATVLASLE